MDRADFLKLAPLAALAAALPRDEYVWEPVGDPSPMRRAALDPDVRLYKGQLYWQVPTPMGSAVEWQWVPCDPPVGWVTRAG